MNGTHDILITQHMFGSHNFYYPFGWSSNVEPIITYGSIRSHDYVGKAEANGTNNLLKWCNIETAKGVFNFTHLDAFVNYHLSKQHVPILTLDGTPSWAVASPRGTGIYKDINGNTIAASSSPPDNYNDFADFWATVVERYGDTCVYEFWNEPTFNMSPTGYFVGTAIELATMMKFGYEAVKSINQTAIVVSPSCVGSVSVVHELLNAPTGGATTGADWFDVLGFHFYNSPINSLSLQSSVGLASSLRSMLLNTSRPNREIWNTESGVENNGLLLSTPDERRTFIRQFFALRWAVGIYRNWFFAYDSNTMGLRVPQNTGATYDLSPYWQEFHAETIGKKLVESQITLTPQQNLQVLLRFDDGSTIVA